MNADRPAAARDRKLPILDGCALSLKIGSQVVKPLRGRLIRRLFEAVVEIIRRYALVVERRSNRSTPEATAAPGVDSGLPEPRTAL